MSVGKFGTITVGRSVMICSRAMSGSKWLRQLNVAPESKAATIGSSTDMWNIGSGSQ